MKLMISNMLGKSRRYSLNTWNNGSKYACEAILVSSTKFLREDETIGIKQGDINREKIDTFDKVSAEVEIFSVK